MADQVSARDALAQKIAEALINSGRHFNCDWPDKGPRGIDQETCEMAALISPLLPEGDGQWADKYEGLTRAQDGLIEGLEKQIKEDSDEWDECHAALTAAGIPETEKSPMGEDCLLSLESRIRKLAAKAEDWIPCAPDNIPELGKKVLVVLYGKVTTGYRNEFHVTEDRKEWFWQVDTLSYAGERRHMVTHWRPLPSPPAEGPAKEGK